jgi:hypothetical protein
MELDSFIRGERVCGLGIMIPRLGLPSSEGTRTISALSVRSTGIQFPSGFSHDVMEQTDVMSDQRE